MEFQHLKLESESGAQINLDALYQICPACFTEIADPKEIDPATGRPLIRRTVNFETLRQLLGDFAEVDAPEAYEFTWPGKQEARREVARPCRKTLRPVPEESEDWDTTQNLYIEGDNLEVLKLLQKSYLGKVKMIYIDPPYNTGNDFVYDDDFHMTQAEQDEAAGNVDELGNRYRKNTDSNGKFHSDWCSMIYSRLMLARTLLVDDGLILVSIGDRELKNLQAIMDEVFGAVNQVCCFVWKSRAKPTNAGNARFRPQKVAEYVLVYSRTDPEKQTFNVISAKERTYPHEDEGGKFRTTTILTSNRGTFRRETMRFESHGFTPSEDFRWKAGKETIDNLYETNHMFINDDGIPMEKKYTHEEADPLYPIYTYVDSDLSGTAEGGKSELGSLIGKQHGFDTVKPVQLIKYLIQTFMGKNEIILDFFSGSATTAQAVMEQNYEDQGKRKYILVQIKEPCDPEGEAFQAGFKTICDIGLSRIKAVANKITSLTTKEEQNTFDTGFRVFRVDSNNMKDVYFSPKDYSQDTLGLFFDNVKEDRTDLDLLFGCMLDWGVQLSLPMQSETVDGCRIYTVNEGDLVACFAENITDNVVKAIAEKAPLRVIFRDSSFAQDDAKINVYESFKQLLDWSDDEVYKNIKVI